MSDPLQITLKTLTPLWTGGVDQTSDRLHETGLIGSLRWWYEALVRGLGGYACDPTGEDRKARCEYDPKKPAPPEEQLCAACYLFGCTGWGRLFRLQIVEESIRNNPLHFYTTLSDNRSWLRRIFMIDNTTVPFGKFRLDFVSRGQDEEYAFSQLAWTLEFSANKGGLGAKLQHGFGQVEIITHLAEHTLHAEQDLKKRLEKGMFKSASNNPTYPSRQRFFSKEKMIPANDPILQAILQAEVVSSQPPGNTYYVPCAFDLRYKGENIAGKQLGFRQWLISEGWRREEIRTLMGESMARRDDERSASRVCFSMPWRNQERGYTLRVFGFVPPNLNPDRVKQEVREYLDSLFTSQGGQ